MQAWGMCKFTNVHLKSDWHNVKADWMLGGLKAKNQQTGFYRRARVSRVKTKHCKSIVGYQTIG